MWCNEILFEKLANVFYDFLSCSSNFGFYELSTKKFIQTLQKVKNEMTVNPDPNVIFFNGELTNGIWKGTIRQYDHTGRFCIEPEYLNGEFACTIWM